MPVSSPAIAKGRKAAVFARRWVGTRLERLISPRIFDLLGVRRRRFERAAKLGVWCGSGETVSGDGSSVEATKVVRAALPLLLTELDIRTLLDVPCGDWNWMSRVELPVERYIGGDIVTSLVDANRERYGSPDREFRIIDVCIDVLPTADMLLCRDALIHFSFADVWRALENIGRTEVQFLATTTFMATSVNSDQPTGLRWRHLNLRAPPFNFPEPMHAIVDNFNRDDQRLCVWRVSDVPRPLPRH